MHDPKPKPGPQPDRLELEGPWEDRLREAIVKQKPAGGWPKAEIRKKKRKKRSRAGS